MLSTNRWCAQSTLCVIFHDIFLPVVLLIWLVWQVGWWRSSWRRRSFCCAWACLWPRTRLLWMCRGWPPSQGLRLSLEEEGPSNNSSPFPTPSHPQMTSVSWYSIWLLRTFFLFVCIFSRSVPNIMFPSIKRLFYNVYFKQFLWNIVSSVISALPSEWRHCWKRLMNYECLSVAFLIISTIVLSYDSILNIGTVKNHKRTCRRNEEFDDLRECCVLVGCE